MNRRQIKIATAATGVVMALGTLATACGASSHGTGTISPVGTYHGIRYCSYTPDSDGIEISHHEAAPCVVNDTRSKNDRKKTTSPTSTTGKNSYSTPKAAKTTKAKKTTTKH
jgi:hypothetical protein